jgi:colanic acid biosynthesis protein WcaH
VTFLDVIRNAPQVANDLIVKNSDGGVLFGRRRNAPAQGYWFSPGDRIRKNEKLAKTFGRLWRLGIPGRQHSGAQQCSRQAAAVRH